MTYIGIAATAAALFVVVLVVMTAVIPWLVEINAAIASITGT